MGKPTTKTELLFAAEDWYRKLWEKIEEMPQKSQESNFQIELTASRKEAHWTRDKNLRDVLMHLYAWHQLMLTWVDKNEKGKEVPFLPPPYNWKTYGKMNVEIWEKAQTIYLEDAKNMFQESHLAVMKMISGYENQVLFENGARKWTGSSTLGAYCISNTSSHYQWALKKLKANKM